MDTKPRISKSVLENVRSYFLQTNQKVFKLRELKEIMSSMRQEWGLQKSVTLEILTNEIGLQKTRLDFPQRPETRYHNKDATVYEIAATVKPKNYFSHQTALFLNKLISEEPTDIFINAEQTPKPRWDSTLEQKNIDRAFKSSPRVTTNIAEYEKHKLYLLSGKQTGNLGVVDKAISNGRIVPVTNIERTLIDVVVRPAYSGGLETVQKAFHNAKGKVSVRLMMNILSKLDHLYPYHQSIGFLLDQSGVFSDTEIEPLSEIPKEFDFHLAHKIQSPKYSKRWKIYYPSSIEN